MASPIPHQWQVPKVFRDRMGNHAGRQRCMVDGGHVLLVLHSPPGANRHGRRDAVLFWRTPDGTWACSRGGPPSFVPLRDHVEQFVTLAEACEARIADAATADEWYALVRETAPLARLSKNLADAVQDARAAVEGDHALITIRDSALDAARAFELLAANAREGLDYTLAKRAEDQARQGQHMLESAHRLNLIAAVFLPMTAVATVFGMNLAHGLESMRAPWLFWGVTAVAIVVGLVIRASLPRPPAAVTATPPPRPTAKAGARPESKTKVRV
ncbi:MAG: hypothetical protein IPK74_37820 [Deltaproteobacteria bacterium]|nr:hypothetical protein [Deltaproteobacteria bacterium]